MVFEKFALPVRKNEGSGVRACAMVRFHGDLSYEFNRQKIEFPPPKKPFEGKGKILLILKRQSDGQWKIALESWNRNPLPESR